MAGRWHRLAAGSKNVPPDLEFELRDRKLPDLHLKTGTRGRENINLHFRALVQMQKKSLTSRPVHKNLFLEFPEYQGRFMLHFDI